MMRIHLTNNKRKRSRENGLKKRKRKICYSTSRELNKRFDRLFVNVVRTTREDESGEAIEIIEIGMLLRSFDIPFEQTTNAKFNKSLRIFL